MLGIFSSSDPRGCWQVGYYSSGRAQRGCWRFSSRARPLTFQPRLDFGEPEAKTASELEAGQILGLIAILHPACGEAEQFSELARI
jgi:hypothetical protein